MESWTAAEIVRALLAEGFAKDRQRATSHAVYIHPDGRVVVVAMHRGDIKAGTLAAIRRESHLPFRK